MTLRRHNPRRDTTEREIIAALKAHGFTVLSISQRHAPDLVIGRAGVTRLVEVKTGRAQLSAKQLQWWGNWRGNPRIVLRSVDDVHALSAHPLSTRSWATRTALRP